ncbi:MAG: RICIN domain-containing protein [Polyangia bacterium]
MRNVRTSYTWIQVVALGAAFTSACVENDDKKAPPAPVEPAAVTPPEPGRAAVSIDPAVAYTIATASGKCLQFSGGSKDDSAPAETVSCNGSKAQQYNLQTVPGGYYTVINADSGKCLDIPAFAMGDNAVAQQYQCNGGQNQHWILAVGAAGNVRLIARHSGKALTVSDTGGDASVGKVTQAVAGAGANQQFKVKGPTPPEAAAGDSGAGGRKGKESRKKGKAAAAAASAAKKP